VNIRRVEPRDADFLLALIQHEETRPFLGSRAPATRADVLADIERQDYAWFVGEVDGEPVGCVAYEVLSDRHRIVEAGRFAIDPRHRGRGYGIALARAFQRLVLGELGFHRIELKVYGFNERAIAHVEASGYVREGVKRRAYLKDGVWTDAVMFALTQEDLDAEPGPHRTPRQDR
jgi:RimJ/RimL family protein N-acetyltransferase